MRAVQYNAYGGGSAALKVLQLLFHSFMYLPFSFNSLLFLKTINVVIMSFKVNLINLFQQLYL